MVTRRKLADYVSGGAAAVSVVFGLGLVSTPAQAIGCGTPTLLSTLLGGATITCDSKTYSNFSYTPNASGGGTLVPASGITVDASFTGSVDSLQWTSVPFSAGPGGQSDGFFDYTVTALTGKISGVDSFINGGGSSGTGSFSVAETYVNPANGQITTLLQSNTALSGFKTISPAATILYVTKDLGVSGNTGTASVSAFEQSYHQSTTPLPASWVMMLTGLGMFGFVTYRRRAASLA